MSPPKTNIDYKGIRIVCINEPQDKNYIDKSKLIKVTGNDTVYAKSVNLFINK